MDAVPIKRILIVDDNLDAADVTALLLTRFFPNAAFDVGYGGAEAIALALAHRPDVALIDFEMPTVNGAQAAAALRNMFPGSPPLLVLFTGNVPAAVEFGAMIVFDHILSKPLNLDMLLQLIKAA